VEFWLILDCQAPPAQTQSPPIEKFLATILATDIAANQLNGNIVKLSASQCGPFLKTDNALCCITKHVMPKCWSQFEGMRVLSSGLTNSQRFSG